ncbi:MAG: hypothetical protein J5777_07440 [Clostridiales bacterium]|nr:hypothetical protein [Clostridiales bacterium]
MAEIKKCPHCGGTIHNKVAGKYICSQCGNAISESEDIFENTSENTGNAKQGGNSGSGSDWSYESFSEPTADTGNPGTDWGYQSFENEKEPPRKAPKAQKVKKEKKKKEPRQKVYRPKRQSSFSLKDIDLTLWWPILCAGVAGIAFTLIFILMIVNKFKILPLWCTLLSLCAYLMTSLLLWPVFDKAGESPWKALVPVYSTYTLYEISGYKGWLFFLTLIPTIGQMIGLVLGALTSVSLAKKFGKTPTWGILYLFVLFFIGWVMIAVTNMTYNASAGHQKDMPLFQVF